MNKVTITGRQFYAFPRHPGGIVWINPNEIIHIIGEDGLTFVYMTDGHHVAISRFVGDVIDTITEEQANALEQQTEGPDTHLQS